VARRRQINVFGLSFLDAMTCGFGAVVLFFMVINATAKMRSQEETHDLQGEVDLLEEKVLGGHENLVEVRNSLRELEAERLRAQGLSRQVLEELENLRRELAQYDSTNLAEREHLNKLQADLKSLEEENKRLSAMAPSEEAPGERVRQFLGEGDRQYLTGLKVGGERIVILVDASASMLGETLVNVLVRRNLPDSRKVRAEKWQRAVATVEWLVAQLPKDSAFQIHTFDESARPTLDGSAGRWLDAGDRGELDGAVEGLRKVVPDGGTSLHAAFSSLNTLRPAPDNVILLADGLPTWGSSPPRRGKVTAKQRLRLFDQALAPLPRGVPVNVILFPMEGDPMAASAYWKLAIATRGSFLSPSRDWP